MIKWLSIQFDTRKLILLAILLRILIIPFFFHPDIKTYNFQASFLKRGVVNIYSYLLANKEKLPLKEEFVYFPLTYLTLGSYQAVLSPFLGKEFDSWLGDASQDYARNIHVFRYLFILKLPYLIVDVLIGFVIYKFFEDKTAGRKAMLFWLFNPFTIAIIYFYSNVDIFPVFFSLLSLLFLKKNKIFASAVLLALSVGFKAYPIFFLPFMLLSLGNTKKIFYYLLTFLPLLALIIFPFWGDAFSSSALVSGLTTRLLIPQISLGFGENIIIPIVLLSILFWAIVFQNKKNDFIKYIFVLFLILFSFIHFHIQWLLWVSPLMVILAARNEKFVPIFLFLASIGIVLPLLYNDRALTFSLFRVFSNLYTLIPPPFVLISRFYDPGVIQGVLHSIFAGISLILSYKILSKEE